MKHYIQTTYLPNISHPGSYPVEYRCRLSSRANNPIKMDNSTWEHYIISVEFITPHSDAKRRMTFLIVNAAPSLDSEASIQSYHAGQEIHMEGYLTVRDNGSINYYASKIKGV